jgi:AraC-like DNA-binding protein
MLLKKDMDNTANYLEEKYYISEVDKISTSIYCYHDMMGELLIPSHSHKKAQLLYTEGGIVYVVANKKRYFLPARHFMWIPSDVEHSIHPSSEKVIMRNLYFPKDKDEDEFYNKLAIYPITDLLLELLFFTNRWNGDLVPNTTDFDVVKAIKLLLPKVCTHQLPLILPYPKDERLIAVIEFIDANLENTIYLPELASQFRFTEKTLSRLFKKDLNLTFVQYLTTKRILKFIQLVLEKKYSISNASIAVGYKSMPTFSNTFYKIMRQRPSDYFKDKKITS